MSVIDFWLSTHKTILLRFTNNVYRLADKNDLDMFKLFWFVPPPLVRKAENNQHYHEFF